MTNKKKTAKKKNAIQAVEKQQFPVEWYTPDDIKTYHATDMTVSFTGHDFVVSFFEVRPPLILGSMSERRAQSKEIKSVRKQCVSRIAVNVDRMPAFIKAFQTNLKRYKDAVKVKN